MSKVFVLDTNKYPLIPCTPRRARLLLSRGKAAVFRRYPFTLILKPRVPIGSQLKLTFEVPTEPVMKSTLRLKIDPGSKTTGLAIVNDVTGEIVFAAELNHRGQRIKAALADRRALRRNRRQRKTRYRQPRFLNRTKPKGWLAPSLLSRVENVLTWVKRLQRLCPLVALSQELVRFDMQLMENAEISGEEYQRGTLYGTELKEYLLEKWKRQCAYCSKTDTPLEIEHMMPKSRGGSNRLYNLTLACHRCNEKKGNQTAAEFGYPALEAQAKKPLLLKDAAAVNSTLWALYHRLEALGLPLEVGTGARTKWNRSQRELPKTHWLDAACVGVSTPGVIHADGVQPLQITATGHGRRQMCTTDKYGFPKVHKARAKSFMGFQTGDMVRALIPSGKYAGRHVGRVTIRFKPHFTVNGVSVHPKYVRCFQRSDGYAYVARNELG
jgi:5-methylcytosine-specific restriction endonuclease McrA